jgi:phage-related protein
MKRVPAVFFRTDAGREPLRVWLKAMDPADRKIIGEDIKTIEFGWPVGMPLCGAMGDGVHEIRSRLASNREARLLFYIDRLQRLVPLHGFLKKSRTTPAGELAFARANKRKHERDLT